MQIVARLLGRGSSQYFQICNHELNDIDGTATSSQTN